MWHKKIANFEYPRHMQSYFREETSFWPKLKYVRVFSYKNTHQKGIRVTYEKVCGSVFPAISLSFTVETRLV